MKKILDVKSASSAGLRELSGLRLSFQRGDAESRRKTRSLKCFKGKGKTGGRRASGENGELPNPTAGTKQVAVQNSSGPVQICFVGR
jgi:hypothetical protein